MVAHPPLTTDDAPRESVAGGELVDAVVIPVLAESATVGKEVVRAGAVRVRIEVDHGRQHLAGDFAAHDVQHVVRPIGEPASERRDPYVDGDELVIPVYEERPVVERRLFLKEEVRLRRVVRVDHREADVAVRRERAVLERQQPDGSWREMPIGLGAPLAEPVSSSPVASDLEQGTVPFHLQERDDEPDTGRRVREP
jgi:stress response protein YsnF